MKNRLISSLLLLSIAGGAHAHNALHKVRVINSQPVYQYVNIDKPVQYCSDIRPSRHNAGPIIAGSVIGATIGHMSASRQNKDNAAVMGAVIGGVLGSQLRTNAPTQQCITRYETTEKVRVLAGYQYWYRIKGKTYEGFSEDKPGRYVLLRNR